MPKFEQEGPIVPERKLDTTPEVNSEKERGTVFQSYGSFYDGFKNFDTREVKIVRIYGKRLENGTLVDDPDPSSFVDSVPHKINESYANMNVYKDGKITAYFRLDDENISDFHIKIIERV